MSEAFDVMESATVLQDAARGIETITRLLFGASGDFESTEIAKDDAEGLLVAAWTLARCVRVEGEALEGIRSVQWPDRAGVEGGAP